MTRAILILVTIGRITAADLSPLNISPTVDHASLAVFDWNDRVHLYRIDGALVGTYTVPTARSVSVDAERYVAVAGGPGKVLLFNPMGKTNSIDIKGFEATNVCLGADHSVWVMVRPSFSRKLDENLDYPVLRHYSWDGELIGTALQKSTFPSPSARFEPSETSVGGVGCRVFGKRVGVYLNYGGHPEGWWVELDMEGKEIGRWSTPRVTPRGVGADEIVYGRGWDGAAILKLDRDRGVWVRLPMSARGDLVGVDANDLDLPWEGGLDRYSVAGSIKSAALKLPGVHCRT